MNHFTRLSQEKTLANCGRIEAEALSLRQEANRLGKRYWHRKRELRAMASEKMSMVRTARWLISAQG